MVNKNNLAIICGASRGIGKTFADYYRNKMSTEIMAISRSKNPELISLDLLDDPSVNNFVDELDLKKFDNVVYMHSIGIDKFEPDAKPHIDRDGDGIDDEVYSSNVTAFFNMAEPLIEKAKTDKSPLTILNIGSISDIYEVPYWQSFSKSKNIVRKYLKSVKTPNIKSLFLNVSSTLDEEKRKHGRKNINTTYWQTTKELLDKSIEIVENMKNFDTNYAEFDFYKSDPNFREDYFTNLPKLFSLWQKDMGFEGKDVPHGIRI